MPTFILAPRALPALGDPLDDPDESLDEEDHRDDYSTDEGDGVWIATFLNFVAEIVQERTHQPDFSFSDDTDLTQDILDEIEDRYVRRLAIAFTNRHYEQYREHDVELPNYDDVRQDCRSFCDDCEHGWTITYGEYDGPLPEDVPADEDERTPGLTDEERQARHTRNQERTRERERREAAREEAESEIIDRDFTCEDDCDSFYEHVNDHYLDSINTNWRALKRRWREFLEEVGEDDMPELVPEY
jgi:hypothetical protein